MIGDFGEVLVIDWGLAKVLPEKRAAGAPAPQAAVPLKRTAERAQTLHGVVLGTPGYMAPEQEHGEIDSIDERADVYGLGVLLGFLMPAGTPRSIQAIAKKARSKDADERYSAVAELARDVNRFLDRERVTAYPEGPWETGRRLVARHRVFVILIATYLAVRIVLLLIAR